MPKFRAMPHLFLFAIAPNLHLCWQQGLQRYHSEEEYEAALKVDNYLLAVQGSAEEQERARAVLAVAKSIVVV